MTLEQIQKVLGPRYRLTREVGGGGMATVYLAEEQRHGRQVAIKVLSPDHSATFAAARFLREIEIVARLQHPHIVPLLDSGEAEGVLYLIMPFVEGESLRTRLGRDGRLALADVVRILADVTDALAYAHRKGIVHRDIKPDNILLAGRHALVTDFGVAKAVSDATVAPRQLTVGVALGTPTYMAPEQATADPAMDHRVDLYALGVVGYEMLAGRPPFDGPSPQAILTAHVLDDPAPVTEFRPETPPALAAIVARALAKRPEDRWPAADDLLRQLEPLATPSGGSTPPGVLPWRGPKPWRGWLLGVAAGIAGLVLLTRVALRPVGSPTFDGSLVQRQVTFSGMVGPAVISPDGQAVAYVDRIGERDRLQLQDLRGGAPLSLAERDHIITLAWSGDGGEIRFISGRTGSAQAEAVPRLGGPARSLGMSGVVALSPDGDRMARFPNGSPRLTLIDLHQGDSSTFMLPPFRWHTPAIWSLSGRRIAAAMATPEERRNGLVVLSLPGGQARIALRDSVWIGSPAWSGRDDVLYYLRTSGQLADLMVVSLDRDGVARGAPRVLVAGLSLPLDLFTPLTVSHDGRRFLYTKVDHWSNLALLTLDDWRRGRTPTPVTTGSALHIQARFSPDGKMIAFTRDEAEGTSLRTMPSAGGVAIEVARFDQGGAPDWSPDGSTIVIPAYGTDRRMWLRLLPVGGGPGRSLLAGGVGWDLGWTAGSLVAIQSAGNRSVLLIDPATGVGRGVPLPDTGGWSFRPRFTPDGRRLAYLWYRSPQMGVYTVQPGDTVAHLLHAGTWFPLRWSRDGQGLFLASDATLGDSVTVISVAADGSGSNTLAVLHPGQGVADISPDGRTLLLNLDQKRADAWLIERVDSLVH
jgi:eukaryotic-like serine/threonine-protein kinase